MYVGNINIIFFLNKKNMYYVKRYIILMFLKHMNTMCRVSKSLNLNIIRKKTVKDVSII